MIEEHIDRLFMRTVGFRVDFLGVEDWMVKEGVADSPAQSDKEWMSLVRSITKRDPQRMLTMRAEDIPSDSLERIEADFKAKGIINPSDAEKLGAYWTMHEVKKSFRESIPPAIREQIRAKLAAHGRKPTDADIAGVYQRMVQR